MENSSRKLDETPIPEQHSSMTIADGFPGQRMLVLPRPRVRESLASPGTRHLTVTDCGYFPDAHDHGRRRDRPIRETVVMVCARGRGWCETAGGSFGVGAGEAVVLAAGHPHAYGADPDAPWTLWWLHVDGSDPEEFLSAAGVTPASPVRTLSEPFRAIDLIAEVLRWTERDETTSSLLAASGAAWHLLALIAADRTPGSERHDAIDKAAEHLRAGIAERVSVAELASAASLSTSHFATLFARRMGVPVLRYKTQLRMSRARELLDTTKLPISHIAGQVGYPDPFYFSRQFRRIHGLTPLNYRQRAR